MKDIQNIQALFKMSLESNLTFLNQAMQKQAESFSMREKNLLDQVISRRNNTRIQI